MFSVQLSFKKYLNVTCVHVYIRFYVMFLLTAITVNRGRKLFRDRYKNAKFTLFHNFLTGSYPMGANGREGFPKCVIYPKKLNYFILLIERNIFCVYETLLICLHARYSVSRCQCDEKFTVHKYHAVT